MEHKIVQVSPADLTFDFQNPRIAEFSFTDKTPEKDIIEVLWDVMGVDEIVLSIKASGFFEHEPLIGIKSGGKNIIIEGNRRLAAVKYILDSEIAEYVGGNKNLRNVSKQVKESLETLPVIFVESRKHAWKFIGFKHINGPAKWGSYAKAQYISEIKNEFKIPLADIASQIGDTHRTVQKLYQSLQVIEQAEKLKVFDRTDITANRLYFSHLYTGLGYEGFREFLGISEVDEEEKNPVPEEKKDRLGELLIWLFGSKKRVQEPVVQTQNPHLRYLEAVVKSSEAISALRSGVPLPQAYELSRPKQETFEQSLLDAKRALQKAQSYQTEGFDGTDIGLLKLSGTIAEIADDLYKYMENKWEKQQGNSSGKKRRFQED